MQNQKYFNWSSRFGLLTWINICYNFNNKSMLVVGRESIMGNNTQDIERLRGVELSGVKRIRIHDLRHSHASLLISKLGAQPQLVADRLGHEKIQPTLSTYSHLYPNQSRELANQLNGLIEEFEEEGSDGNAGEA